MTDATSTLRAARDLLLERAEDQAAAVRDFRWPELDRFNWALDWFDEVAATRRDDPALRIVEDDGRDVTHGYGDLAERSNRLANWLRAHGVGRGDRVLMVLGNRVELWESILALSKLGAVIIPATTLLTAADIADRVARGEVRHVIAEPSVAESFGEVPATVTRICVGDDIPAGWHRLAESAQADATFAPDGVTRAGDLLLLYFTSGTTALPKLVGHTHASYPAGHLSTMYWIGLRPGDVHCNVSSPGWAKHAWSNVFAPWIAEACAFIANQQRFSAPSLLATLERCEVTTLCAPPTVWRMLIQEDLSAHRIHLREVASAGEPLNPEVIEQVRQAWGLTIRDGYGQTETTAQIGNPPGQPLKPGSMGRPLPGYRIALLDPITGEPGDEGEICIDLSARPLALMTGYLDDPARTAEVMRDGHYHTGDVASRDAEGYITYVGRSDDVFKASDYRISPFELESVLIEHPAVAEAAVVPSPDALRLAVPKAFVVPAPGHPPNRGTALAILRHARERLAPYKRVRRLEFAELPKTISGKIRRVELRAGEQSRHAGGAAERGPAEFWEEDFPELRGGAG